MLPNSSFKQPGMRIRPYTDADLSAVAQLFTDAVHGLGATHYDAVQRKAWAPQPPDLGIWEARLKPLKVLVAQDANYSGYALLGFVGYEEDGHIDLMFSAPQAARRGVASQLFGRAETALRELGVAQLYTEASLLGRPFFARHGFTVKEEQQVERRGVQFLRYAMVKALTPLAEG